MGRRASGWFSLADDVVSLVDVDGVPAVVAPFDGPTRMWVTFRVGVADQRAVRAGVNRVACAVLGGGGRGGLVTSCFEGDPAALCAAVREPSFERVLVGRRLPDVQGALLLRRFGVRAHGLAGAGELGLGAVGVRDVREWIGTWFTRENAVLSVAGAVPAGLRLGLPAGVRWPTPAVRSLRPAGPLSFAGHGSTGVAFDLLVPDSPLSTVHKRVLSRVLLRALRTGAGLASSVTTRLEALGDGVAQLLVRADAAAGTSGAVLGAVLDVLAALQDGQLDAADVAAARGVGAVPAHTLLAAHAWGVLIGQSAPQPHELMSPVSVEEILGAMRYAHASTIVMTPPGHRVERSGYTEISVRASAPARGRRFAAVGRPGAALVVGTAETGLIRGHEPLVTVRFDSCAAVLAWPDGARRVIGVDGFVVHVEPTLYADGLTAVEALDAALPADLVLAQAPRDSVPGPPVRPVRLLVMAGSAALAAGFLGGRAALNAGQPLLAVLAVVPLSVGALALAVAWRVSKHTRRIRL